MESRAHTRPTESKLAFSHSPGRITCTWKVERLFFILGKLSSPFHLTSSDHPGVRDGPGGLSLRKHAELSHSEGLSWSPGIYFSSKYSRTILTLGQFGKTFPDPQLSRVSSTRFPGPRPPASQG